MSVPSLTHLLLHNQTHSDIQIQSATFQYGRSHSQNPMETKDTKDTQDTQDDLDVLIEHLKDNYTRLSEELDKHKRKYDECMSLVADVGNELNTKLKQKTSREQEVTWSKLQAHKNLPGLCEFICDMLNRSYGTWRSYTIKNGTKFTSIISTRRGFEDSRIAMKIDKGGHFYSSRSKSSRGNVLFMPMDNFMQASKFMT